MNHACCSFIQSFSVLRTFTIILRSESWRETWVIQRLCAYQLISLEFSRQSFLPFKCAHLLRTTPAETLIKDKNIFQIDLYNGNKLFCIWLSLTKLRGSQTASCFLGTGFPVTKDNQISSQSQGKHSNTISTRLLGSFFCSISSLRNSFFSLCANKLTASHVQSQIQLWKCY